MGTMFLLSSCDGEDRQIDSQNRAQDRSPRNRDPGIHTNNRLPLGCEAITDLNNCENSLNSSLSKCAVLPLNGVKKCLPVPPGKRLALGQTPIAGPQSLSLKVSNFTGKTWEGFLQLGQINQAIAAIPADVDTVHAVTRSYACGTTANGEAKCWGDGAGGRTNAPANLKFSEIKARDAYACGRVKLGEPNAQKISCWGQLPAGIASKIQNGFLVLAYTHPSDLRTTNAEEFYGFAITDNQLCASVGQYIDPYFPGSNEFGFLFCSEGWERNIRIPTFGPGFTTVKAAGTAFCAIKRTNHIENAVCWSESANRTENMTQGLYFTQNGKPILSPNPYNYVDLADNFACFINTTGNTHSGTFRCLDRTGNAPANLQPPATLGEIFIWNMNLGTDFACAVKSQSVFCWGPGSANILNTMPQILKP